VDTHDDHPTQNLDNRLRIDVNGPLLDDPASRSHARRVLVIAARLLLASTLIASCSLAGPTYAVSVEPGLTLTHSVDQVAGIAVAQLTDMARVQNLGTDGITITKVSAVRLAEVAGVEPGAGGGEPVTGANNPTWVVRLNGPFYTDRTLGQRLQSNTGHFEIDDVTGLIIGMGMP
jgi:hypothetical protein